MDVIVVDEEHRQPIQRPFLTVVIDIFSRMVLGFAIYLEKPSAFRARDFACSIAQRAALFNVKPSKPSR